uniref:Uncharacterized protein n=1 Tax=Rhizophora mucronata TaxID=61149 RepID=A0A2P2LBE4_RHIMU
MILGRSYAFLEANLLDIFNRLNLV